MKAKTRTHTIYNRGCGVIYPQTLYCLDLAALKRRAAFKDLPWAIFV